MIFDTDDMHEGHDGMDLLLQLKEANQAFRMTAFVVPAFCSPKYLASLPLWIECVGHGWHHGGPGCPDPREAEHWSYEDAMDVLLALPGRCVHGWKSPGWMISDGTYAALLELGYWCADHPRNDARRPDGLRCHILGEGDHVHTHVQNVCGNGLEETFDELLAKVKAADRFDLISESVRVWRTEKVAA